jgi:PAS domain S-box-containing protein
MNTKNYRSRGKAKVLLNLLSDPAAIVDGKGNFLTVNDAFEEVTGLSWKELIGNPFVKFNILTPESKTVLLENLKKRIQCAHVNPYELYFADKLGEKRCVEVKGKMVSYAGTTANLAVFHDVTLRKENARRLKEYSERMEALVEEKVKEIQDREGNYRKLFDESLDAIFVADAETGIIVDCNPAASKLVGREKSELVGQHQSIIHPKEQIEGEFTRGFKQHLKDPTKTFETQVMRKTGEIRDAAVKAAILELNGKKLMQGTFRDITEEKLSEQRLKEAEKRYHALFDQAPLGVLVIDPETAAFVEFNDIAHLQLGYSREEFGKLAVYDIEAEESADEVRSHTAEMVREGGGEFETEHRTKNGDIRNVLVTTRTFELAGRTFLHSVFHDITEIRKVQKALMESETQYRQLVELAQEGIWALDNNFNTVFVNPHMAQMLGYTESEIIGKSLFDFLFKADVEQATQYLSQFKQGMKGNFEYEFMRKDGSRVNTSIAAAQIRDDEGSCLGTLALVSDITLRKKMENELRQETEKLETITESIGAGLTITSKDYRILWTNKVMKQSRGIPDIEGRACYATYNYLDNVCPECGVKKVFEGKEFDSREYSVFDREKGETVWLQLIATPIKDKSGNVTSALELVLPITERKMMEQSLKDSEAKLAEYSQKLEKLVEERTEQLQQTQAKLVKSERLAAIGELAGMVGHDLRNPLTGIKNAAYYLKKNGVACSEGQAKEMLEIIDRCINHSNKIINDLLDYSREIHLDLTEYAPRSLFDDALRMIQVPDRIQIVNHVLGETQIRVDTDKMMRVFINLITNAIDAMPEKGTLKITSRQTGGKVEIAFADTGMGIPEETLSRIFSPLFTTKAQGMGFGLAICKRIVEAHGGTIGVETAVNKGTTFTITLPVKPKVEIGGEKTWINMPESLLSTTTKA